MDLSREAEAILVRTEASLQAGVSAGQLRRDLFGKAGEFAALLKAIAALQPTDRAPVQRQLQSVRQRLEGVLSSTAEATAAAQAPFDRSLPGLAPIGGTEHPISQMIDSMTGIFGRLGFEVVEGPEIVNEDENFEWLNIGPEHPARDGHDSFYLAKNRLLRTQTTAVQVLEMRRRQKSGRLPIRVVVPGKTYRRESDPTHSPMFHQIDAVMVDAQTTFADLRGCLQYLVEELFGDDVETRFRPHHFPFTEPSAELDIRWKHAGSRTGKHTQWLEMGGCGMIHPDVLRRAGLNPQQYRGWAFGMSVERPVMVKYGVSDLRRLYDNNLDFLSQFPTV